MTFLDSLCGEDDEFADKVIREEIWYLARFTSFYPCLKSSCWRAFSFFYFIFSVLFLIYFAISFIITALKSFNDFIDFSSSIHYSLLIILGTSAILSFFLNRKTLVLVYTIKKLGISEFDTEIDNLRNNRKLEMESIRRKIDIGYIFFSILFPNIVIFVAPVLDDWAGKRKDGIYSETGISINLPLPQWSLVPTDTLFFYLIALGMQLHMVLFNCTAIFLFLHMYITICQEITLELSIMKAAIQRLLQLSLQKCVEETLYRNEGNDEIIKQKYIAVCYKSCLKQIAIHHQQVIRMFRSWGHTISIPLFLIILCAAVNIAASGLTFFFASGRYGFKMVSCILGLGETLGIFMITWAAELMYEASEDLFYELYNTNWMGMNKDIVKMKQIMLTRAKHPLVLTVGKIMKVNYQLFREVMERAYSFFNVIYAMIK